MKEISLFILWLLLISIVSGEDFTCEAGYGISGGHPTDMRTSGSSCSGVSIIRSAEECITAAEYNSKNIIDNNKGFNIVIDKHQHNMFPPGCFQFYNGGNKKYSFNGNLQSSKPCSGSYKCICKTRNCIRCPPNTYSEGGINSKCIPCPEDQPYTPFWTKHKPATSISQCLKNREDKCDPGHGIYGAFGDILSLIHI